MDELLLMLMAGILSISLKFDYFVEFDGRIDSINNGVGRGWSQTFAVHHSSDPAAPCSNLNSERRVQALIVPEGFPFPQLYLLLVTRRDRTVVKMFAPSLKVYLLPYHHLYTFGRDSTFMTFIFI